jgi:hypothetical protein
MSLLAVCVVAFSLLGCGGPTEPKVEYVTLTSVRYVRTRPAVAPTTFVGLNFSIPRPTDAYNRPIMSGVGLRAVDDVTFVYDYPETFRIPVGYTCTFYVLDAAVSPYSIATDLFVNGTEIHVEKAGDYEYGRFKVDASGRVYFD